MSDQLPLPDELGDSEGNPEDEEEEITCMLFDNLESVCIPFWVSRDTRNAAKMLRRILIVAVAMHERRRQLQRVL